MASSRYTQSGVGYALELDGQICASLNRAEGGDATADVVKEAPGPDRVVRKHLAGVKYEDITLAVGADLPDVVTSWISATLAQTGSSNDGAIIDLQTGSRLEFTRALIREITFPRVDASSKNTGSIEIKLAPQLTRSKPAAGHTSLVGQIPTRGNQYQRWLVSNFRLQIDGLDCSRVSSIDTLTISCTLPSDAPGESRDYRKPTPGALDIPNLAFTIEEAGADLLIAWHQDFVINGNRGASAEKNGTLQFLAPNLSDVLFALTFQNLGIFRLALEKTANDQTARRLRAEMYCEEIGLQYSGAAASVSSDNPKAPTKKMVANPQLRGAYVQGVTTMPGFNFASAGQAQQPSPDTVTKALNLGRPQFKFRT